MSYVSEQSAATNSFFLGLCFAYSVVILTNHRLYALRNNPTVYYSIISGSIAVVLYEIVGTLHKTGYANSPVVLALIFLSVLPQHYGIYAIMNQRLLPVLFPTAAPKTRLIYDIALRCLLGLPTTVAAIIALANLESFLTVFNIIMPFVLCSVVFSNGTELMLTILFLRIILKNHQDITLYESIFKYRQEWGRMLFGLVLTLVVVVFKILELTGVYSDPVTAAFHNCAFGLTVLVTFDNYMAITKDVTKDILVKPVQYAGTQNKGLSLAS